ncbi:hypothetical protein DKX38_030061 (mitochondrion) [Salix brachista]|uniref:Uncharacterized protein n=1 Tax=Salix brachista TaxID=2182728 RepID=A0A5N5IXW1_9ROSI|nr:hypothetical protein DKX38_030061 [Salix brachista]
MKAEVCLPAVCNMSESKDKDHEARTQRSGREEWVEGRELLGISQPIRHYFQAVGERVEDLCGLRLALRRGLGVVDKQRLLGILSIEGSGNGQTLGKCYKRLKTDVRKGNKSFKDPASCTRKRRIKGMPEPSPLLIGPEESHSFKQGCYDLRLEID